MQPRRPLYIVGAGDFGRELESMLETVPAEQRDWSVAGYIDDDPKALDGLETGYTVVGSVAGFQFPDGSLAVLAISEPATREQVSGMLKGRVRFFSYVHPTSLLFKFVRVGEGVIVGAHCIVSNSVHLGRFVILNQGTQIGHDSTIGDYSALMSNVDLGGKCHLGDRVFVGTGATLVPGIRVGADAKVGSGSVVIKNVKERVTVFGNPAKVIAGPSSPTPAG